MIQIYEGGIIPPDIDTLNDLIRVVSSNPRRISLAEWKEIEGENFLFLARDMSAGEAIVGMATLVFNNHPAGRHALLEDVAVLPQYQGRGIFHKLMDAFENKARELRATVRFTSNPGNPKRANAIRGYEKRGYKIRDTNVYEADPFSLPSAKSGK